MGSFRKACGVSAKTMEAMSTKMPKVPPSISYRNGNEHSLYLELFEFTNMNWLLRKFVRGPMSNMNEKMIYQRNRAWVKKISEFPAEPKSLITVGVKHLYTSQGVIALLRKDGWTVEHYDG